MGQNKVGTQHDFNSKEHVDMLTLCFSSLVPMSARKMRHNWFSWEDFLLTLGEVMSIQDSVSVKAIVEILCSFAFSIMRWGGGMCEECGVLCLMLVQCWVSAQVALYSPLVGGTTWLHMATSGNNARLRTLVAHLTAQGGGSYNKGVFWLRYTTPHFLK